MNTPDHSSPVNDKAVLILGDDPTLTVGLATELHKAGCAVVIGHDRQVPPPAMDLPGGRIVALSFADPDLLTEEVHGLGPIRAAILAPRWFGRSFFLNDPPDWWDTAFALNFEGAVYTLQAVSRSLIVSGEGGSIVVLSSVAALRPHTELAAVGASLAALNAIARLFAVELGDQRIRVNVLALGWTEGTWDAAYATPGAQSRLAEVTPDRRLASLADIGAACRMLIADDMQHLTGAVIPLDGAYLVEKAPGSAPDP